MWFVGAMMGVDGLEGLLDLLDLFYFLIPGETKLQNAQGDPNRLFTLTFEYALYDYTNNTLLSFGVSTTKETAKYSINRKDWVQLIESGISIVLSNSGM